MTISIETLMRAALRNAPTTALLLGLILATAYGGISDERQDWRQVKSLKDVHHIIVIYQENWSFDSLHHYLRDGTLTQSPQPNRQAPC